MFRFNKKESPYLWRVHQWGTILHWSWNKDSRDICQMVRRMILGVFFISITPPSVSFIICSLLELPIQFSYGLMEPVFSVSTVELGLILYCSVMLFISISLLFYMAYLGTSLVEGGYYEELRRSVLPDAGLLMTWYRGFKDKYCARITMDGEG